MQLSEIVEQFGTPSPDIVSQLDKGNGTSLDYVGHADITKLLIAVDPTWTWEPAAWIDGRPAIHIHEAVQTFRNGEQKKSRIATMWGYMSVLGKSLPCVGSAPADKEDYEKELVGDLIRNGAMRFGICVNLWSKTSTTPVARPNTQPFKEYQPAPRQNAPAPTGSGLSIKGTQHGALPDWLAPAAAEQGITQVYDNRDSLSTNPKRPWFKCTSSGVGLWPPKGTPAPVITSDEPQWDTEEEPF